VQDEDGRELSQRIASLKRFTQEKIQSSRAYRRDGGCMRESRLVKLTEPFRVSSFRPARGEYA
jgi:hypothetical protein